MIEALKNYVLAAPWPQCGQSRALSLGPLVLVQLGRMAIYPCTEKEKRESMAEWLGKWPRKRHNLKRLVLPRQYFWTTSDIQHNDVLERRLCSIISGPLV